MSKRVKEKNNTSQNEEQKMSKEQESIAKYLRFNCPTSTTMFEGNEVHYFTGTKAVDTLWESKFGNKNTKSPLFKTRDEVVSYISDLYSFQLFFRAKKLVPKKKEEKEIEDANKSPKGKVEKLSKKKEEVTETENDEEKKDEDEKKTDSKDEEKAKKKKKVKLLVHNTQVFVDDKDVYVWIYDPTPLYKKVIGVCMLLGTIVGCLFPLWPHWLRLGVYYLSLCGVGLFGAVVLVAILRTILFCIIYAVTAGQHKLWILPNLTEDCGVLESFQPYYTYEYCPRGGADNKKKDKSKKKGKKEKNSDNEDVKEDNVEDEKNEGSIDGDFEKVGDEENDSEASSNSQNNSVPSSPEETIRKRRPVKA